MTTSFWVRNAARGQLAEAMPRLRALIADAGNIIIESNSVLRFLRPDIFITVTSTPRSPTSNHPRFATSTAPTP